MDGSVLNCEKKLIIPSYSKQKNRCRSYLDSIKIRGLYKQIFTMSFTRVVASCQDDYYFNYSAKSIENINRAIDAPSDLQISEFIEYSVNEANLLSSYVFALSSNEMDVSTGICGSTNDSYLAFKADGRTELRIIFPYNLRLFELSDDWYFISQDEILIRFENSGDALQF